jgi:hypothetical protein
MFIIDNNHGIKMIHIKKLVSSLLILCAITGIILNFNFVPRQVSLAERNDTHMFFDAIYAQKDSLNQIAHHRFNIANTISPKFKLRIKNFIRNHYELTILIEYSDKDDKEFDHQRRDPQIEAFFDYIPIYFEEKIIPLQKKCRITYLYYVDNTYIKKIDKIIDGGRNVK